MAGVPVLADVVTVSCSHQHIRVIRGVNCGAWEDLRIKAQQLIVEWYRYIDLRAASPRSDACP